MEHVYLYNFKIDCSEAATLCAERLFEKATHLNKFWFEGMFTKQKYMDLAFAGLATKPNRLRDVTIRDNSLDAKKLL